MKKAVLSNRIFMHKEEGLLEKLLSELTYEFQISPNAPKERICNVINISDKIVSIPIGRVDLIPKHFTIIDKRIFDDVYFPDIQSGIVLRESQQEIYDKVDDSCIINAKPGWGKTFTAIFLAKKLKKKTLVITHTTLLRDQWIEECKKVFGNKEKIGILGGSQYSIGEYITIGNIQTVIKYIKNLSNEFGTIIVDEAHRLPSNTFTEIVDVSKARYKIGLTGTLGRKDKKHILIPNYTSSKIIKTEQENVMIPVVLVFDSKFAIPGNHMMPWATRINKLAYDPAYQAEIVNIVLAQKKRGHKILVLSDRTEFLENCQSVTPDSICITSKVKDRDAEMKKFRTGVVDTIYGAIGIFKEGISENALSCVILASPINNIYLLEQIIGRIIRKHNNKMQPEVIDIKLKGKTGTNQYNERQRFYKSERLRIISLQLGRDI